jgi:penicillin-binding protein-related factor A (putative recombinase)
MEEEINYQGKFVPFTKTKFEAKDRLISNIILEHQSKYLEGVFNYANPLIGANGKYYMVLNNEVLHHFTQAELDSAVDYDSIILPTQTL